MANMRAMVLDRPKTPLSHARAADSGARAERNPGGDRGLRRLPHRPARRRRRTAASEAADRAGPRDRRPGAAMGAGGERISRRLSASACPGSAIPAASAPIAAAGARICAIAPLFTGYTRDGGYATHAIADAAYCFPLPERRRRRDGAAAVCRTDRLAHATDGGRGRGARPLRLRRRRAYSGAGCGLAGPPRLCLHAARRYRGAGFARSLGAVWAGGSDEMPPEPLDAAIIFAPVGALVPAALKAVKKGGAVVCGGIHMSDIPSFPYALLWEERQVRSVANLTRDDAHEFFAVAPKARHQDHGRPLSVGRGRTRPSTICAPAACKAPRCCCRECVSRSSSAACNAALLPGTVPECRVVAVLGLHSSAPRCSAPGTRYVTAPARRGRSRA